MLKTTSQALVAALALIAAPAFTHSALAQDAAPAEAQTEDAGTPNADAATETADTPADAPVAADTAADTPAETPAAPAGDTPAAQDGTAEEGAARDAAAEPTDGPGSYYAKSEHGEWTIRCIRAGQGKDPCEMYKLLSDENDNAVAEFSLVPLQNGDVAAGATLVAPLETDLIEGVGMQVDGGEIRGYPFAF